MKRFILVMVFIILIPAVVFAQEVDTELEVLLRMENILMNIQIELENLNIKMSDDFIVNIDDIRNDLRNIVGDNEIYGQLNDVVDRFDILVGDDENDGLIVENNNNLLAAVDGIENIELFQEYIEKFNDVNTWLELLSSAVYVLLIIILPLTVIVLLGWWVLKQFI